MNVLKMISLSFALSLIGTYTTFAQSLETGLMEEQKKEIKKNIEEYAAALNLSEDQRPKFEDITKKYKVYLEKQGDMKKRIKEQR